MNHKANGKLKVCIRFFLFLLMCFVLVTSTVVYLHQIPGTKAEAKEVLPGVNVEGIDLSSLKKREGIERLAALESRVEECMVNLRLNNQVCRATLAELGVTVDREETMNRALALEKDLGFFERWYAAVLPVDLRLNPVLEVDREKMRSALQNLIGLLEMPAENAHLEIGANNQVQVVRSHNGYSIDTDTLAEQLINQPDYETQFIVEISASLVKPEVTREEVQSWGVTGLLSEFSTRFNPQQTNRNHNIAIAAGKLDGYIIKPGEVFSFNQVVGPRGIEQGYRKAGVIVGNKLEEDVGGGVCQVSTTLYNAVLLADLAVQQRSNHNIPVSYVPMGRDAAVAYDYLDLKFNNNSEKRVMLKTIIRGNTLTVKVFGSPVRGKSVEVKNWVSKTVEPETIYKLDPKVEPGSQLVEQKGAGGYKAATERVVLVDGKVIRREALPVNHYRPVERIIAVHSEAEIPRDQPVEGVNEKDSATAGASDTIEAEIPRDELGEGVNEEDYGTDENGDANDDWDVAASNHDPGQQENGQ